MTNTRSNYGLAVRIELVIPGDGEVKADQRMV